MRLTEIDKYISELGPYLKANTKRAKIPRREGDQIEVELPFKNRRGDNIQIYITQKPDGSFILSDANIVSSDLFEDGVNIMGREIEEIAGCFDVEFDDPVLHCSCSPNDFSETLFRFVRCLTVIDYLAVTEEYPKYISNRPAH